MSKTEKIIERVYIAGGLVLLTTVIMAMSSCGTSKLTNEQVEHRNNIDYQLDKLYLEYSYERDSLIIEFYKK